MADRHDTRRDAAPQAPTIEQFGCPISFDAFEKVLSCVALATASSADDWRFFLRGIWEGGYRPFDLLMLRWDAPPRFGTGYVLTWTTEGDCFIQLPKRFQHDNRATLPVCREFERLLLQTPPTERTGRVFLKNERNGRSWASAEKIIDRVGMLAGISLTSSDLRISWAAAQLERGTPAETVGAICRHTSAVITKRFCEEARSLLPRHAVTRLLPQELPQYAIASKERKPQTPPELLLELFDEFAAHNRQIRSEKTALHYRLAIRQFGESLGRPARPSDLSDDALAGMEKHLAGLAVSTVNERLRRVKAIWSWCCRKGILSTWPTITARPEPEPHRRAWTVDEMRRLLEACESFTLAGPRQEAIPAFYGGVPAAKWWRLFHLTGWETGERTGALLKLRWEWVTAQGLDVPAEARKAGKGAYYRLSGPLLQELEQFRAPTRELIFPWSLHMASFWNHYGRLLKAAGLPTDRKNKPQKLRRTHLTFWAIGGQDATARAKHASPETTQRHYLDERMFPQVDPSTVLPSLERREGRADGDDKV